MALRLLSDNDLVGKVSRSPLGGLKAAHAMVDRGEGEALSPYEDELERIEDVVGRMHLPPGYLDALDALRLHIDVVRTKLARLKPD